MVDGVTTISGEETTILCPEDTIQYSCQVSNTAVNSITWSLKCPDQQAHHPSSVGPGVGINNVSEQYACTASGVDVTFDLTITFTSSGNSAQSNISITANYTTTAAGFGRLRLDCEESGDYRYLSLAGKQS